MRALLRFALRCYPSQWRSRYGAEFQALLDDLHPTWLTVFDVVRGGLTMRLIHSTVWRPAAVCAAVGLAIAGAIVFVTPPRYASTATMLVRSADSFSMDAQLPGLLKAPLGMTDITPDRVRVLRVNGSNTIFQISVIDTDPGRSQEFTRRLTQRLVAAPLRAGVGIELLDDPGLEDHPINADGTSIAALGLIGGGIFGVVFGVWRSRRSVVQV